MEALEARVERRHRVVLRRLDVDLVVGVLLLAGIRRSFRRDRLDDGWTANHRPERRLMQGRIHRRDQRLRGTGTAYRLR